MDTDFNPGTGANSSINAIAIKPDGNVLIVGGFTSYNGTARNGIARLNVDGSLDYGFFPGAGVDAAIESVALQPDAKILIGGSFTSYNGTARNRIARLNVNGSLNTGFNPGTGASSTIFSIARQPDEKVLIGGSFTSYNDVGRNRITRILGCTIGSSCNDGSTCTVDDVYGSDCTCAGTLSPDSDADGTCDVQDGCPSDPMKTEPAKSA